MNAFLELAGAALAGAVYCRCLWGIAARVARRRRLVLGSLPCSIVSLCGAAAFLCARFVAPDAALPAAASLIGAIVCALVDARTGYIFDALSWCMLGVGAVAAIVAGRFPGGAFALTIVGGGLMVLYFVSGRGIGLGDVKLGSVLALGYGLQAALIAIGSAFILGAVYAVVLMLLGRAKRSDSLRFGPFIAGGAAVGLGAEVLGWPW